MLQHLKEKILKIIILRSVFLIILLTALISCSEENTTEPVNNPPSNIPMSKLSDIQAKVFTQSCALSGCHGSTNNQANLLLTEGNSFNNLVNIQSLLFPQFKRVAPNTSSNSLLIKILKGGKIFDKLPDEEYEKDKVSNDDKV